MKNLYDGVHSTADNVSGNGDTGFYGNPNVITGAGGAVGYQWKPFDSVPDDDRDLKYYHYGVGVGYQLTDKACYGQRNTINSEERVGREVIGHGD